MPFLRIELDLRTDFLLFLVREKPFYHSKEKLNRYLAPYNFDY